MPKGRVIDGFLHLPVLSSNQPPFFHPLPKALAIFTFPLSVAIFGRCAVAAMTDDGMAEIWNDLRLARSRNENLRRVCERVAAEASALGERFGSVHGALRVSYEESRERERALAERSRSIEERERMFGLLRGKKEEVLAKLEGRIKWCEEECARKERELARASGELKDKEIELKSLRMSCEESFEEYGQKRAEVEELRGGAAEAARRVQSEEERLKALEGFVEKRMKEERSDEDLRVHILLLERLIEASSPVMPDIDARAPTLVMQWKTKLRAEEERPLEVSVFLHLVAAFGLITSFDKNEIAELVESLPVNRTCSRLYKIPGIAEKRPGKISFTSFARVCSFLVLE